MIVSGKLDHPGLARHQYPLIAQAAFGCAVERYAKENKMTNRDDMEERLGETEQEHKYGDDPPPKCERCGRVLIQEETGLGRDDWGWACVECD